MGYMPFCGACYYRELRSKGFPLGPCSLGLPAVEEVLRFTPCTGDSWNRLLWPSGCCTAANTTPTVTANGQDSPVTAVSIPNSSLVLGLPPHLCRGHTGAGGATVLRVSRPHVSLFQGSPRLSRSPWTALDGCGHVRTARPSLLWATALFSLPMYTLDPLPLPSPHGHLPRKL